MFLVCFCQSSCVWSEVLVPGQLWRNQTTDLEYKFSLPLNMLPWDQQNYMWSMIDICCPWNLFWIGYFRKKKRNITFGKIDHHIAVFLIPGKGSFSGAIIYQIICKNLIKFPKDSDRFPNLKCKHMFKFTIGIYMDRHSGHIIWQKGTKVIKMLTNDAAIPTSYLSIFVHHSGL